MNSFCLLPFAFCHSCPTDFCRVRPDCDLWLSNVVSSAGHMRELFLMSIDFIPLPVLLGTMAVLAIVMVYFIVGRKFMKK